MKGLFVAAGVTALLVPLSAAYSAVYTVGGPLSKNCYDSALATDARPASIEGCTLALEQEPLQTPDRAATYVNRGILRMVAGRFGDAAGDFDAALALNANLSDAWLNKGFIRLRQGNGREALPLLQRGMDHGARRQALAYFARGVAYEQMGDFRSAYYDLKRARDLEPRWTMPGEYLARYRVERR
jgi:tetratricopeptide (TPR) repeat protein